jgi:hypothetical protein
VVTLFITDPFFIPTLLALSVGEDSTAKLSFHLVSHFEKYLQCVAIELMFLELHGKFYVL